MEHDVPPGAEMLVMPASFVGEKAFTFTTNPAVVRRQIAALSWGEGNPRPAGRRGTASCENLTNDLRADMFTAGTMGTLTALLTALHQVDGRKAVILLTDGLISVCRDEVDAPERLRRISEIANRGSSVLYGVDTKAFTSAGSNMLDDDLQYLAERTGGLSGRSNAIDNVLARVAADQEGYYLLAYEPPPSTFKKGRLQYRDVKVTVTKPDLRVRARAGFYNVPDGALKLQ
jgi:VWFA-related protein